MRIIGAADEFWRIRLTRVDTTGELDFEWHDDILYREPRVRHADEIELWKVEALRIDDAEQIVELATFDDDTDARDFAKAVGEDLEQMTKSVFEERYINRMPSSEGTGTDSTT